MQKYFFGYTDMSLFCLCEFALFRVFLEQKIEKYCEFAQKTRNCVRDVAKNTQKKI